MVYVSYFSFFSEIKQVANDLHIELKMGDYKAEAFDTAYTSVINKLVKRSKEHADTYFSGKSKFIAQFISDIRSTKTYPQSDRFSKLLDIIDDYIRRSV